MRSRASILLLLTVLAGSLAAVAQESSKLIQEAKTVTWKQPIASVPQEPGAARALARSALERRLKLLGYERLAEGTPDFYVAFHLVYLEGRASAVVIDFIDVRSKLLIWRGLDTDFTGRSLWTARFKDFKTYTFREISGWEASEPIYQTTHQRLRRALEAELIAKGYELEQAPPTDLAITYYAIASGADARAAMVGKLTVEVVEPESNEVLWRGEASTPLGHPDQREAQISEVIHQIFEGFPASKP